MDFDPTPEQKEFGQEVERFAEGLNPPAGEIGPAAGEGVLPAETLHRLGSMRLMGVVAPQEEGGAGRDLVSYALAQIAVSKKSVSIGAILFANNSLYVYPVLAHAEIGKRKYLRPCCTGEGMGSAPVGYAFADPGEIPMKAVRSKDGWSLDGRCALVGNGILPTHAVLPAITGEGSEVSLFVLDLGSTAGLCLTAAQASERVDLVAEHASLPGDALLGTPRKGLEHMERTLPAIWVGVSAHAVGIGRSILERAVAYSLGRKRSGKPLFSSQSVQWTLADMATELDAAEFLVLRAAWLADRKKPCEKEAAMAKLYSSDAALKAATHGGRIMGDEGLDDSFWNPLKHAERCQIEHGNTLRIKGYITGRLVRELKGT